MISLLSLLDLQVKFIGSFSGGHDYSWEPLATDRHYLALAGFVDNTW